MTSSIYGSWNALCDTFNSMLAVAIAIALILLVVGMSGVKVVPDGTAYVIERLSRYHRTALAGMQYVVPLIDRVAFRFALNAKDDQLSDTCVTLDNIAVRVASNVRWQVVQPHEAAYGAADVAEFVVGVVRSAQRQWIGERAWNDVRENTRELEAAVERAAKEAGNGVGVEIEAVEVRSLERAG